MIKKIKSTQKRLLGLLSIFFILTATSAGLILIKQNQNISEKASTSNTKCTYDEKGLCGPTKASNCKTGERCVECGNNNPPSYCCKTDSTCGGSGNGGGGTTGNNSGSPTPSPTAPPACKNTKSNPATFSGITKSGNLFIYGTIYRGGSGTVKIAVKLNATSCGDNNADKVIEQRFSEDEVVTIDTRLAVKSGDKVCAKTSYKLSGNYVDFKGWIPPDSENKCTKNGSSPKDLTPVTEAAGDSIASKQCWEGDEDECKYNSMGLVFGVGAGTAGSSPQPTAEPDDSVGLKVRFQGITSKKADQKVHVAFESNGSTIWSQDDLLVSNDDNGVYTIPVSGVAAGTYNIRVKGHSHLQKLFPQLVYNGTGKNLSTSEDLQMKAGDVTDDNQITIDDVALVSSFYSDFSVAVDTNNNQMVASDINKDGIITIQDLALIAINWSDIRVTGDQ